MSTTTTRLTVSGMTCGHCSSAVTTELRALAGVREVAVDLVPGGDSTVTIISDTELEPASVVEAVSEAGEYTVAF